MPGCTPSPVARPRAATSSRRRYARQVAGSGDPAEVWHTWVVRLGDDGPAVGYVQATVRPARRLGGAGLGRRTALAGSWDRPRGRRARARPRPRPGVRVASSPTCTPSTPPRSGWLPPSGWHPPTDWSTARSSGCASCRPRHRPERRPVVVVAIPHEPTGHPLQSPTTTGCFHGRTNAPTAGVMERGGAHRTAGCTSVGARGTLPPHCWAR